MTLAGIQRLAETLDLHDRLLCPLLDVVGVLFGNIQKTVTK